jgi:hypothetical protein
MHGAEEAIREANLRRRMGMAAAGMGTVSEEI